MIILGVLLLLIGFFFHIHILFTIGIIVLIIGAILLILQIAGHGVGNRYWY